MKRVNKARKRRRQAASAILRIVKELTRFMRDLNSCIRLEPTCIRCGCTDLHACEPPCSWTFLNKQTNEGVCSICVAELASE